MTYKGLHMGTRPDHHRQHRFLLHRAVVTCLLLAGCAGQGGSIQLDAAADRVDHSATVATAEKPHIPGSARDMEPQGRRQYAANETPVVIGDGPDGALAKINVPFVSVTVCRPGTRICQTINHILVDTGSYGLRIIAPNVVMPSLALPPVTGPRGHPVAECAQLFNGFLWGSVRRADVKIAGETAMALPVQQIGDADPAFHNIPAECSNRGTDAGTVHALGANGILGIGLFKEDCGAECAKRVIAGIYYECAPTRCVGTLMPLAQQVANPVASFATNNNGVVLVMPAVPAGGLRTLVGSLIFGIDTQSNNTVGSATVYAANARGNITTTYKGKLLSSSFLDTGANGLFFFDPTLHLCAGAASFFCPPTTRTLSAVNSSPKGGATGTVDFTVENKQLLDPTIRAASVGGTIGRNLSNKDFDWLITENAQSRERSVRAANVGGSPQQLSRSTAFVWGMPFFFGRTVFVAIDGASTLHGRGPYWAY